MPPQRLLLGPGPSQVHPRVLDALSTPVVGHLDPYFLAVLDETQALLRRLFRTSNPFTLALSGTGSAGMEAVLVNLIEPGDTIAVGINGVFGTRLATIGERCEAKVIRIEAPWGRAIDPEDVRHVLGRSGPMKLVAIVHAETSTGAWQSLEPIGQLCRESGALFVVDAVTSLGGLPVEVDAWGIDACYSATQKCLSCPPGLTPVTVSPRAMTAIKHRRSSCQSWYLDFSLIAEYWEGNTRRYHHTAPISMMYALREALRLIFEEGLGARVARHQLHSRALLAGLATLGVFPLPPEGMRLPTLNCMTLPTGLDEQAIRARLLQERGIEIGGGLGPLQNKVWRIGLMGESAQAASVQRLLEALSSLMRPHETAAVSEPVAAATAVYSKNAYNQRGS